MTEQFWGPRGISTGYQSEKAEEQESKDGEMKKETFRRYAIKRKHERMAVRTTPERSNRSKEEMREAFSKS